MTVAGSPFGAPPSAFPHRGRWLGVKAGAAKRGRRLTKGARVRALELKRQQWAPRAPLHEMCRMRRVGNDHKER